MADSLALGVCGYRGSRHETGMGIGLAPGSASDADFGNGNSFDAGWASGLLSHEEAAAPEHAGCVRRGLQVAFWLSGFLGAFVSGRTSSAFVFNCVSASAAEWGTGNTAAAEDA